MSDLPTQPFELSDENKRTQLGIALATVIRLAKELPVGVDPYASVDIPDPMGATIDVSDHPAIHKAVESFKAAEAEVGIANAVVSIVRQIAEKFGMVIA